MPSRGREFRSTVHTHAKQLFPIEFRRRSSPEPERHCRCLGSGAASPSPALDERSVLLIFDGAGASVASANWRRRARPEQNYAIGFCPVSQDPNQKENTISTLYCTASFPVPVMWSGHSAVEDAGLHLDFSLLNRAVFPWLTDAKIYVCGKIFPCLPWT